MIKVLIVDDEPLARENLRVFLQEQSDIEIVGECSNAVEGIGAVHKLRPDVLFLDIQMPRISGLEMVGMLDPEHRPYIVFLTAFDEYAIKAFEEHAFDYLLKPLSEERFQKTMDLCQNELAKHIRYIEVKESRTLVKIPLNEIIYTDYYNHYIQIHTGARLIRSYQQFDVFSPLLLCYPQFLCCYRNCIVNMDHIEKSTDEGFVMDNQELVTVRKRGSNAIKKAYLEYLFSSDSDK